MSKFKKEIRLFLALYVQLICGVFLVRIFMQVVLALYVFFCTNNGFIFDLTTTWSSFKGSVLVAFIITGGLYTVKKMGVFFFCIFMIAVFWYLTR